MPAYDPFPHLERASGEVTEAVEEYKRAIAEMYAGTEERLTAIVAEIVHENVKRNCDAILKPKQKDWLKNAPRSKRLHADPRPKGGRHSS